jgi:hypothetical protein
MKKDKGNKGLSFKEWINLTDKERKRRLPRLTMKESLRLTEEMMRMPLTRKQIEELNKENRPISLKLALSRMRRAAQQRRRRAAIKMRTNRL